jgi:DNA-binding NarL/FixJ family response regulator
MIKVLIADDHAIVREGLKRFLAEAKDIAVDGEATSGQEALKKACEMEFDVVLLDISMPGRSGLDILKELKCVKPATHVLMLSMHAEEEYAERTLKAGAAGYLTKKTTPDELIDAIRKVSKGKKYVSSSVAELLACHVNGQSKKLPHETLSDREYEIMCMIGTGKTVSEIAEELSLSKKTISTHRTHILEKMRLKNNAQLIYYALLNKLVSNC